VGRGKKRKGLLELPETGREDGFQNKRVL